MIDFAALAPHSAHHNDLYRSVDAFPPVQHAAVTPALRPPGRSPAGASLDVRSDVGRDFSRISTGPATESVTARRPLHRAAESYGAAGAVPRAPIDERANVSRAPSGKQEALGAGLGALGGAALGAGVGFGFGGPLGALIGGGIGAVAGGILGYLAGRRSVTVNITRLAGAADTTDADLRTASTVFGQAGISVSRGAGEAVSAAESTAILGADSVLEEFSSPTLTAEETKLLARNRTRGRITAYWVPSLSAGSRGEAMIPSYHGVADSSIVISSSARAADTFAHELGHVLLDDGAHSADPDNLMASGSIRNFTDKLTAAQITTIKASRYV
ncbi:hypothetical protein FHU33_2317 [Blastococcus colisei]|uniref:Uncharacterized protein n=1 Tax=Blastococcus colisei TaxID=1564162 RepID=A0A543PFT5_9ACTN|nr:hypothetical protein [Blastococcus colisei]TQN42906.1 hypothetical protein FHU33_2317 [Blastococcus colisei]